MIREQTRLPAFQIIKHFSVIYSSVVKLSELAGVLGGGAVKRLAGACLTGTPSTPALALSLTAEL